MGVSLRFSPRAHTADRISWRTWGRDAFDEAALKKRPILLSLSAVWCHWCHVMDETTYSDERVQTIIRERFIPIRVDNDERPDINERYNMGGWPTTAFLTPTGDILAGATYLPPDAMVESLRRVDDWWAAHGSEPLPALPPQPRRPRASGSVLEIAEAIRATYDQTHGGFGVAPKFPQPSALEFLLDLSLIEKDPSFGRMVEATLEAMTRGGLYDPVEGGFFRYATHRDWSEPHYEKMLEDNASLLILLARTVAWRGYESLRDVAKGTGDYLSKTLFTGTHFCGSQDADEAYYALPAKGRAERGAPYRDPTLYAGWCARAVRNLTEAGWLLGEPSWREAARVTMDTLLERCLGSGGLAHTDRSAGLVDLTSDLAEVGLAAQMLADVNGDARIHEVSDRLSARILELEDEEGFPDRPGRGEGRLSERLYPPEVASLVGQLFLQRHDAWGDSADLDAAYRALRSAGHYTPVEGVMAAPYGTLLLLMNILPLRAEVGRGWEPLLGSVFSLRWARRVAVSVPGAPGVVLCSGERCALPATTPQEIQMKGDEVVMMDERSTKDPRTFIERIPTGEDLVLYLEDLARRRHIGTAWISGIGAVKRAALATYNQTAHRYEPISFDEPLELLSLTGNISMRDGEPFAHVHAVLARRDGSTVGGHVVAGTTVFLTELRITEKEGAWLERESDETTGLAVWPKPEA